LANLSPAATVWALDVNPRARELTTDNAARMGAGNIKVCDPSDVPADIEFDLIWSNPPIRIGKEALHQILLTWLGRLSATGVAFLVVQKHLGADSLAEWLTRQGYVVERAGSKKGFRVLRVRAQ
jgi:16S rRNA G1207 methylase RsmC